MQCPRCGNPWDQKKGFCPYCGLTIRRQEPNSVPGLGTTSTPWRVATTEVRGEQRSDGFSPALSAYIPRPLSPASPDFARSPSRITLRSLSPGELLKNGRYTLQALQTRQEWRDGIFEASWVGQDVRRGNSPVIIHEVALPDLFTNETQAILQAATAALFSIGNSPYVPTLRDAFRDHERSFFVFEFVAGESLLARLRRHMHPFSEQEVLEWCLQMVEVLELLAQQSPPLIHGLIQPASIIAYSNEPLYLLTDFSVVLAGGARQYVAGTDSRLLTPYAAPEIARGSVDGRADIYSLLATAYHMLTGYVPEGTAIGSIPSAREKNPYVSSRFDEILTKGLHPVPDQRYQRPSDLRQALFSPGIDIDAGRAQPYQITPFPSSAPPNTENLSQEGRIQLPVTPALSPEKEEREEWLQRPEDLPPLQPGNDSVQASLVFISIIVILCIVVALSHFV